MGRVSKHKKIKSCDPFYKGPRKQTFRKGDLPPPNDEDQPAPRSLLRLLRYSERGNKRKNKTLSEPRKISVDSKQKPGKEGYMEVSGRPTCEGPTVSASENHIIKSEDNAVPSLKGRSAMFVRRPGESTRSFLERIDIESKVRIADCFLKEKTKSAKRKLYLEQRKLKSKTRKRCKKYDPADMDFDNLRDKVKFGEVAKAPPRLSIKPRGSEKKTNKKVLVESRTTLALKNPDGEAKSQVIGLKCKQLLEEDRIRAIKEYRLSKLKQRTQHKNFIS